IYIIDFSGDLYGKKIVVFIEKFLREEENFPSVAELIETMNHDTLRAKGIVREKIAHSPELYNDLKKALASLRIE
ncbi:MAG: hypothetical protein GX791_05170, partial [Synergistaceae bacterium]|nr:hypothetical protein [Synergistaceae bacterium]